MAKEEIANTFSFCSTPLSKIVSIVNPLRNPKQTPFSDIVYSYQKNIFPKFSFKNFTIETFQIKETTHEFSIIFDLTENENHEIHIELQFQDSQIPEDIIKIFLDAFISFIDRTSQYPEEKIEKITINNYEILKKHIVSFRNIVEKSLPNENIHSEEIVLIKNKENEWMELWSKVLPETCYNIDDSFFDVGGNSLKAIRLTAVAKERGYNLSLLDIFKYPTIRLIALKILKSENFSERKKTKISTEETTSFPSLKQEIYLPSSYQEAFWKMYKETNKTYNLPIYFRIKKNFSFSHFYNLFTKLCNRHDILRTVMQRENEMLCCKILSNFEVNITSDDFSSLTENMREQKLSQISYDLLIEPFELEKTPPWRIKLIKLGSEEWAILVVISHLCIDGWSRIQFMNEIIIMLNSDIDNRLNILPKINRTYKEYASITNEVENSQYYKDRIKMIYETYPKTINKIYFPSNNLEITEADFQEIHFDIPNEKLLFIYEKLKKFHLNLFQLSLTAYFIAIHNVSKIADIFIRTAFANRKSEFINTLGCLTSNLIFNLKIEQEDDFKTVADNLVKKHLYLIENEDIDFAEIEKYARQYNRHDEFSNARNISFGFNEINESILDSKANNIRGENSIDIIYIKAPHSYPLRLVINHYINNRINISLYFQKSFIHENFVRKIIDKFQECLFNFDNNKGKEK